MQFFGSNIVAESWVEAEMSWVEVDGAGWSWVELGGGGCSWVELGAGFSNTQYFFSKLEIQLSSLSEFKMIRLN